MFSELRQHLSQDQRSATRNHQLLEQDGRAATGSPFSVPVPEEGVSSRRLLRRLLNTLGTRSAPGRWRKRPNPSAQACIGVHPGLSVHRDHLTDDPSRTLLAMMTRTTAWKEIAGPHGTKIPHRRSRQARRERGLGSKECTRMAECGGRSPDEVRENPRRTDLRHRDEGSS